MTDVKEQSKDAAERASRSDWLEGLARAGLATRGLLYLVVAALAVQVARGHGDERADKQGAFQAVVRQPFGRFLLLAMVIGLGGYALWRFVEAIVGPEDERDSSKATLKRVGCAARGALYTVFFVSAVKLLISSGGKSGSNSAQTDSTARVLNWPGGPWIVAAVGVAIIAGGIWVGWRGVSRKFRKRLKAAEMSREERRWIISFGTVGMVARMIVFSMIGLFLINAALQHDPNQAVGIDGALKRLATRAYGPALLVVVALGLGAYGIYSLGEARFRRVGSH
ncbi:MAG: DUF1206 domain-containing protein [Actinomycetota bacterium]|nr:DUF1206 domain-containing protein [Actinomycetota bacterium]